MYIYIYIFKYSVVTIYNNDILLIIIKNNLFLMSREIVIICENIYLLHVIVQNI